MKRISLLITALLISLYGLAQSAITINPGWTWIPYKYSENMQLDYAFSSINPEIGDVVKSHLMGYAVYTENGWNGSITELQVNQAYHYFSCKQHPVDFNFPDFAIPTITTAEVSDITSSTVTCGGEITANGGTVVTARGVCWSTSEDPSIEGDHSIDGSGNGEYVSQISGLQSNTTYYVKAYATNSAGTAYGEQRTFTTQVGAPNVATTQPYHLGGTTAMVDGEVISDGGASVIIKGICWGTSEFPNIDDDNITDEGTGSGTFSSQITGLTVGSTYYVRAFAMNDYGVGYGEQFSFVAAYGLPEVTTAEATNITYESATVSGEVIFNGGKNVLRKGICWALHSNPTLDDNYTSNGTGNSSFIAELTNLLEDTTYYIRAYATNSQGTGYGNEVVFSTLARPTNPEGTINGLFTINEQGDQAYFSKGNLQYQASTNTWRFAENQWDFVGSTEVSYGEPGGNVNGSSNHLISSSYDGWIDLFGWGTSNYYNQNLCYQPWCTSETDADYYSKNLYLETGKADWGYNPISNGGNQENQWRTPSAFNGGEWSYLFYGRTTASGIRFAMAQVNEVNGMILVPDNWNSSTYNLIYTNLDNVSYTSNIISQNDWKSIMEPAGCVFLPAAGQRYGTSINCIGIGTRGYYWSSTTESQGYSYSPFFEESSLHISDYNRRSSGLSVRLIRLANKPMINTSAITYVTSSEAQCGGNIGTDGGSEIIGRGVCWSTSQNPTITDAHTSDGNGLGSFTSNLTDLAPGTTYYVRAYATNSEGNTYGSELTFTTLPVLPTLTTISPTDITSSTATSGGVIIDNGGANITACGVCWSINSNPTTNDNHTNDASDLGSFTSLITNLEPEITYYVRAYATNNAGTAYGNEVVFSTTPEGAINGLFTINAQGDQVYFSQGNLQYIGSAETPYWRFAEKQWNYIGEEQNGTDATDIDRDLFGWGTSGYHDNTDPYNLFYQPWSTSENSPASGTGAYTYNYYGYGPSTYMSSPNLTDNSANYDWGVYNPISNGGNLAGLWRTLTTNEWLFVYNTRNTTSRIRYAMAIVNGINGVILVPDNWSTNTYTLNNTNTYDASYSTNPITQDIWDSTLEPAGCVFLPAAGYRLNNTISNVVGSYGYYWSSSYDSRNSSRYAMGIAFGSYFGTSNSLRYHGMSVRLVRDYE